MANDQKNVAIGGAVVSIAAWAANAAATGHVDVGILKEPPEETPSIENYVPEFESLEGGVVSFPQKTGFEVKLVLAEATPDLKQIALQQPTANLSGTAPNKTLLRGLREEQYKSIKVVTKGGTGATGVRATQTITYHRCAVSKVEPLTYAKGKEQLIGVTFMVLQDTSVSTADVFSKEVHSGGS